MWLFDRKKKKNIENKSMKNGIIIPAGGQLRLPLPAVRFDKDRCFMLINGQEQLIGEEGLTAVIKADGTRPIKIRISPDSKNRRLDAVEIIDVDDKKEYPKDPQLQFVGLGAPLTTEEIVRHLKSMEQEIEKRIKELDKDMIKYTRRARRFGYIALIILLVIFPFQLYMAYVHIGISRFIDIILGIITIIGICADIYLLKRINTIDKTIKDKNKDVIDVSEMKNVELVKGR